MSADPSEFIEKGYSLENRMIFITDITEDSMARLFKAILVMQMQSDEPIDVYINSSGGSVYDGLALYDLLNDSECVINTYATGKVFSFAIPLFLVGDYRYATTNTSFMVHQVSSGTEGNVHEMHIDVKECKRINTKMINIIAEKTGQKESFWKSKMFKDTYFDKAKAIEWGLLE
jgi:ATP-dependent Clp protease protease subunit